MDFAKEDQYARRKINQQERMEAEAREETQAVRYRERSLKRRREMWVAIAQGPWEFLTFF